VARRHDRPDEIIAKLREAEILLARGMKVPEMVRELSIREVTCGVELPCQAAGSRVTPQQAVRRNHRPQGHRVGGLGEPVPSHLELGWRSPVTLLSSARRRSS